MTRLHIHSGHAHSTYFTRSCSSKCGTMLPCICIFNRVIQRFMTTRKKGFGAPIIIIVVATLVALGAWWYGSQGGTSSGTVSDDAVSSGTVSESTDGSGSGID